MDLGVMVNIYEETEFQGAFENAVEAGFTHGQLNSYLPRITPEEVRLLALAARGAGFRIDAVGCYINPLRLDDRTMSGVEYGDWKTLAENMAMMDGVEKIVCWSGTLGRKMDTPNLLNHEEDTFQSVFEAIQSMLEFARDCGVTVVLEPFTAHVLCDGRQCRRMAEKFTPGAMQIVLDGPNIVTHKEYAHCDKSVEKFISEVAPVTGIVHLKDMIRDDSGRLKFPYAGRGVLNYGAYLNSIAQHVPDVPIIIDRVHTIAEMIAAREFLEQAAKEYGL